MAGRIFSEFIKKRDKRLCGNISQLTERIISREISDIKIAAALVFLKHHRSPDVYRKALSVLDKRKNSVNIENSIEIAYPYGRKGFSPYFLIPAAVVLSLLPDSSIKTVFHGESLNTPSTKDVFDYLNLSPLSFDDSVSMLKDLNISFFNRKSFLPEISSINHIRFELGIKDIFFYLERILNPASSNYAVIGVKNEPDLEFYRKIAKGRYRRFAVVRDIEGFADIVSPHPILIQGKNTEEIDLSVFGIKQVIYRKFSLEDHIEFIWKLLDKKLPEYEKLLFVNGGVLLYLSEAVRDIKDGFDLTCELFHKYDYKQILKNIQRYSEYLNYKNIYQF